MPATLHITAADVLETPFYYIVEASSLGWSPGQFPASLTTTLGNRQALVRCRATTGKYVEYKQPQTGLLLRVLND